MECGLRVLVLYVYIYVWCILQLSGRFCFRRRCLLIGCLFRFPLTAGRNGCRGTYPACCFVLGWGGWGGALYSFKVKWLLRLLLAPFHAQSFFAGLFPVAGRVGLITSRPEPTRTEPTRTEPNRTEPNRTEPNRTESNRTEPNRTEPNRTEPNRTEPNRTEPNRTEPNRTVPYCSEHLLTRPDTPRKSLKTS